MSKRILVTGGNAGIGLALCQQLVAEHGAHVYLGSRSKERGEKGMAAILKKHPEAKDRLELVIIDVASDKSVSAAAQELRQRNVTLYALVNNAGVGFNTSTDNDMILNTNFYGPKRVSEAFLPLIDSSEGRIVNVSSGAASGFVKGQNAATQKLFTSPETTWEELDAAVQAHKGKGSGFAGGYGLSKAALTAYTILQAKAHPNLKITSLSPGFIATAMTDGYGARLTPEQGTVSLIRCLFGDVVSSYYYGSDGLRSPLTVSRDPGTPEYQGEPDPDPARYSK